MNVAIIFIGRDLVVDSVKCENFTCDGNALIRTTIDIERYARIDKTIVAYEGVIGEGSFSAKNAIANEYFEFSGDIEGKIVELDTNNIVSDNQQTPKHIPEHSSSTKEMTIEDLDLIKDLIIKLAKNIIRRRD